MIRAVSRMRCSAPQPTYTAQQRLAARCTADPGPRKARSFWRSRVCSAAFRFASCCAAPGTHVRTSFPLTLCQADEIDCLVDCVACVLALDLHEREGAGRLLSGARPQR